MKNLSTLLFLFLFSITTIAQVNPKYLPFDYIGYDKVTELKIAVFPIDFTDLPSKYAGTFPTKSVWIDTIFNKNTKNYFDITSYGEFSLKGDVYDYTTSSSVFWDGQGYADANFEDIQNVLNSVDIIAPNFDISNYDLVVFIICHDAVIGRAETSRRDFTVNGKKHNHNAIVTYYQKGDWYRDFDNSNGTGIGETDQFIEKRSYTIYTGASSSDEGTIAHNYNRFQTTFIHELVHGLGVSDHANTSTNGANQVVFPNDESGNLNLNYGNKFDLMGHQEYGMSLNGGYRDIIGVLDSSNIFSVNWYGKTTATVFPTASTTGKRYIEVLLPNTQNSLGYKNNGYGLEIKNAEGLDIMLSNQNLSNNVEGFFVYKIEGVHNKLLDMSPSASVQYSEPDLRDVVLKPSMTYENSEVKLENVVKNSNGSFSVDITIKTSKNVTPAVKFTGATRTSSGGDIKVKWSNFSCPTCDLSDQLVMFEYKKKGEDDSNYNFLPETVNLSSGSIVTSVGSGNTDEYDFRVYITKNSNNEASLRSFISTVGTLGLNEIEDVTFKISPNPIGESINFSTKNTYLKYKIFSANGAFIKQGNINKHSSEINFKDESSGIYILELSNNENLTRKKLIKN